MFVSFGLGVSGGDIVAVVAYRKLWWCVLGHIHPHDCCHEHFRLEILSIGG